MQKYWSVLFGVTMLGALILFIVAPFAGWWLPKNVASFGAGIDNLFYLILVITGFFFILTEAILVYALFRFAGRPGHKASYVHGNHLLEITWTLVPGVILLLLAIVQINVWAQVKFVKNMPKADGTTQQMEVIAHQWEWRVRYPNRERMESWAQDAAKAGDFGQNPHVDDVHLANEIHTWKDAKVLVHLKTQDVLHSFFLPNLRLKQDSLPGKTIPVWFSALEHNTVRRADGRWAEIGYDPATGKTSDPSMIWELACAEYCGTRHSLMRGKLYVHETKDDYLEWLKHAEAEQGSHEPASASKVASR